MLLGNFPKVTQLESDRVRIQTQVRVTGRLTGHKKTRTTDAHAHSPQPQPSSALCPPTLPVIPAVPSMMNRQCPVC